MQQLKLELPALDSEDQEPFDSDEANCSHNESIIALMILLFYPLFMLKKFETLWFHAPPGVSHAFFRFSYAQQW